MPKLLITDLQKIKDETKTASSLKKGGYIAKVVIHMGTCGIASGASNIMTALMNEMAGAGLGLEDIMVIPSGCAGLCAREPMATIETVDQPPVKYVDLNEEKIREIFKEHIMGGKPVEKYALVCGGEAMY